MKNKENNKHEVDKIFSYAMLVKTSILHWLFLLRIILTFLACKYSDKMNIVTEILYFFRVFFPAAHSTPCSRHLCTQTCSWRSSSQRWPPQIRRQDTCCEWYKSSRSRLSKVGTTLQNIVVNEELVSKTSYIQSDMLLIFITDVLWQL